MRARHRFALAAVIAAAFAACDLNPQPLPPGGDERAVPGGADASFSSDAGSQDVPATGVDAGGGSFDGAPPPTGDGGDDAGDAGDAGDADADA